MAKVWGSFHCKLGIATGLATQNGLAVHGVDVLHSAILRIILRKPRSAVLLLGKQPYQQDPPHCSNPAQNYPNTEYTTIPPMISASADSFHASSFSLKIVTPKMVTQI